MKLQDIDKIKIIKKNVILVTIIKAKGSVPRNENVSMVISSSMQFGTIGGGELEYQITRKSKSLLNTNFIFSCLSISFLIISWVPSGELSSTTITYN